MLLYKKNEKIFVASHICLLLLFLFLHFSTRMNEPFVVMTPPHKVKRSNKKNSIKKKSFCVIS